MQHTKGEKNEHQPCFGIDFTTFTAASKRRSTCSAMFTAVCSRDRQAGPGQVVLGEVRWRWGATLDHRRTVSGAFWDPLSVDYARWKLALFLGTMLSACFFRNIVVKRGVLGRGLPRLLFTRSRASSCFLFVVSYWRLFFAFVSGILEAIS